MAVAADGELGDRIGALGRAVEVGGRWLPAEALQPAVAVIDRAGERLRHGTSHTVVALAGPTGSGKSTLYNALTGHEISTTGVLRPTTGETHAAVWGDGAEPLLDWLEIRRRHVVDDGAEPLAGLVLLDLPDHDSTAVGHRLEVDRLVELVDLLVWVVDPQKYADRSLHERYLRRLARFGSVMRFVLSKADTMTPEERLTCADDLAARLREDGIAVPEVLTVSARAPVGAGGAEAPGLGELVAVLEKSVEQRRAALERLEIEVTAVASALPGVGDGDAELTRRVRRTLVEDLARAAGVDAVARAAGRRHRRQASSSVGWLPARWVGRVRPRADESVPDLRRSEVGAAGVGSALRAVGEAVGEGLDPVWASTARGVAVGRREELLGALALVASRPPRRASPARWWSLARHLQVALAAVAALGVAWLLVLTVAESFLRLDVDPLAPHLGGMPVPTLLALGGALAGLGAAGVAGAVATAGARRHSGIVRRRLRREILAAADEHVTAPLEALLVDRRTYLAAAGEAVGGDGDGAGLVATTLR